MRTCKVLHDLCSVRVHRTIVITDLNAHIALPALLLRSGAKAVGHRRAPPLLSVRYFAFHHDDPDYALRLLPLLADVLAQMSNLQYLCLHTHPGASPALIALFKRRSIVRQEGSAIQAAFYPSSPAKNCCSMRLPRLLGVESSCSVLLCDIAGFRTLRALAITDIMVKSVLCRFLDVLSCHGPLPCVEAFTCSVDLDDFTPFLRAATFCFPNLKFLDILIPVYVGQSRAQISTYTTVRSL